MRNFKAITEKMYKAVKILLNGGASVKEAADYMNLSTSSVYSIRNTENYEEFLHISRANQAERSAKAAAAINAKQKTEQKAESEPQVVEHRQTVQITATHYMMEEMKKTNEYLKTISAKLAFIVDELCGTATKKEG